MSLSSGLAELFKKTESKLLPDSPLWSNRVIVLVGFVVVLIVARSFLTEQVIQILGSLVGGYILSGTITKSVQTYWNGRIRLRELELAYADGKLDDNETKLLASEGEKVKA